MADVLDPSLDRSAWELVYELIKQAPVAMTLLSGPSFVVEVANDKTLELWGKEYKDIIHIPALNAFPELEQQGLNQILQQVFVSGKPFIAREIPLIQLRNGTPETRFVDFTYEPLKLDEKIFGIVGIGVDVTAQVEARNTIAENEQQSFDLLAQAAVGITVYQGEALKIVVANDSALEIWGKSREELIGKPVLEIAPEVADSPAFQVVKQVFQTGAPFEGREIPIEYLRNGQHHLGYFDVVYTAWRASNSIIKGVITVYTDVTHSVLARKKVEESEERFRGTFENAAVGIAHVGLDGSWLMVNDRLCQIVGYSKEELLTLTFQHITHPNDLQNDLDSLHLLLDGKIDTYSMQKRYIRKEGTVVWINLTVSLTRDDQAQPKFLIAIVQDISQHKKAEDALKQSEDLFRTLADNIQNLAWMADENGSIFWFNQRWYDYTGTSLEQMQGWGWLAVHHPQYMDKVLELVSPAWQKGEPFELTFPLRRHDNKYRWFLTRVFPVKNEKGNVTRWVGTSTDIEEQKTAEEKLEKLVERRTKELQRSNDDLQQFAHVASHDLKEPVRKIRTFGNRLAAEFGSLLPEEGKLYLQKMEHAAKRIYELIDGVLLYSSLNALDGTMEEINLHELIQEIRIDLEVIIEEKNAAIDLETLPRIKGSPILIYQLFYNLINNSLKFSKQEERPQIRLSGKIVREATGAAYALITLKDNGIGFQQSEAEMIFKPFSRLNSKSQYEGTGLGLALCKKIVERHSGTITAVSEGGKGAQFHITLPGAS